MPETTQHVAYRRLTDVKLLSRPGDASREHQRVEGDQQVDIERPQWIGHRLPQTHEQCS